MTYTMITGASSGIGLKTAYEFAKNKKNLILVARTTSKLEELKNDIESKYDVSVLVKSVDLINQENVEALYNETKDLDIDTLVNNAGFGTMSKPIQAHEDKDIYNVIDLNVKTLVNLTRKFILDRSGKGGTLINVGSEVGYETSPMASVYAGTKFFVNSFTEMVAQEQEMLNTNIKVKLMSPGAVNTEFVGVAMNGLSQEEIEGFMASANMVTTPEKIAECIFELTQNDKTVCRLNLKEKEYVFVNAQYKNFVV